MKEHPIHDKYFATKDGEVIGARGKPLSLINHHTGYKVITVRNKQLRVHRFIWECFNGVIDGDKVINHIDGDKHNNSLSNLELVTQKQNAVHAFDLGLRKAVRGEDVKTAKLTNKTARQLIKLLAETDLDNPTLASKFGLHSRYVSLVRHRRRWKHLWVDMYGEEQ